VINLGSVSHAHQFGLYERKTRAAAKLIVLQQPFVYPFFQHQT